MRDPFEIAVHDLVVDRIEAGGVDLDHDLAGIGDRIGNLYQPDLVGDRSVTGENKPAHQSILLIRLE